MPCTALVCGLPFCTARRQRVFAKETETHPFFPFSLSSCDTFLKASRCYAIEQRQMYCSRYRVMEARLERVSWVAEQVTDSSAEK